MCVYDNTEQPNAGQIPSNQELVGIHNDSASKSWSKLLINFLSTCVLLSKEYYNTLQRILTIPCENYLQQNIFTMK